MNLVECTKERHAAAIRDIYNDVILNTPANYDAKARTLEQVCAHMDEHARGGYPWFGFEDDNGTLAAFGTYGAFRGWEGYRFTVELSVYVARPFRGRGLGLAVMREIEARARKQGLHVLVGCIDGGNVASVRLHERAGYAFCGRLPETGFKFGRFRDILFYDKILS